MESLLVFIRDSSSLNTFQIHCTEYILHNTSKYSKIQYLRYISTLLVTQVSLRIHTDPRPPNTIQIPLKYGSNTFPNTTALSRWVPGGHMAHTSPHPSSRAAHTHTNTYQYVQIRRPKYRIARAHSSHSWVALRPPRRAVRLPEAAAEVPEAPAPEEEAAGACLPLPLPEEEEATGAC